MRFELSLARRRRKVRGVSDASGDGELLPVPVDGAGLLISWDRPGNQLTHITRFSKGLPVHRESFLEQLLTEGGYHTQLAAWSRQPRRPAVAQADVIKHRLLGGGLGFLVAGQHRQ